MRLYSESIISKKKLVLDMQKDASRITVKDIMTESVISVDATTTINEASKMMEDAKVGAIIVTDNNLPVGIVTDRDFAVKVAAHAYNITSPVKRIMSSPLIVINGDESIWMVQI